jgi:peptidoglycan/xylan/chitin deacetylase (PgdA/CDA1 family)
LHEGLYRQAVVFSTVLVMICTCFGYAIRKPLEREVVILGHAAEKTRPAALKQDTEGGSEGKLPRVYYTIAPWHGFRKAACSLTFDDGTMDQYVLAFPELQKREIGATFFLITRYRRHGFWKDGNTRRKLFSWDQARRIHDAGHEIGSHTRTHPDLSKPEQFLRWEMGGSLSRLKKEFSDLDETTFAWPYWRSSDEARDIAAEYYLAARAGTGFVENYWTVPEDGKIDLFRVDSLCMRSGQYGEPWRARVEAVLEEAGWLVLCYHGIDDGRIDREWLGWDPITVRQFTENLDWVQGRGFWIAPFGTVARYILERDNAVLSLVHAEEGRFVLSLEDGLEDGVFSHPLTLKLSLPVTWRSLRISQHRREVPFTVSHEGRLLFDALPDGTPVYIERM